MFLLYLEANMLLQIRVFATLCMPPDSSVIPVSLWSGFFHS